MTGLATAHASMLQEENLIGSDGNAVMSYQNFLINGAMDFAQRIGSGNQTVSSTWGLDRWQLRHNFSSVEVSRQDHSYNVLGGGTHCMRLKSVSQGPGTYLFCIQSFELPTIMALLGKTVTFSAYIRRSGSWAGGARLGFVSSTTPEDSSTGLGNSGTSFGDLNIDSSSLTTSFQRFSTTVTIPTTVRGMGVMIRMLAGTTVGDGQYLEVTNMMLNIGSSPAPFQRAGGTVGAELQLCQRFYEKSYDPEVAPGTAAQYGGLQWQKHHSTTMSQDWRMMNPRFSVLKRAAPSCYTYSFAGTLSQASDLNSEADLGTNSAQVGNGLRSYFWLRNFTGGNITLGPLQTYTYHWTADAEL